MADGKKAPPPLFRRNGGNRGIGSADHGRVLPNSADRVAPLKGLGRWGVGAMSAEAEAKLGGGEAGQGGWEPPST